MRLTPIEIRRHRFSSRVRGFDRDEVRAFLDMVIADFEDVVRQNAQLRRDNERLRGADSVQFRVRPVKRYPPIPSLLQAPGPVAPT